MATDAPPTSPRAATASTDASSGTPTSRREARRAAKAAAPPGRRNIFWRWRRPLFLFGLLVVLAIAGAGFLFSQVPLPDKDPPLLQTTFMCANDVDSGCNADNSIAQLSGGVDRVAVTYNDLPPVLVNAVVSAEDRGFFKHGGVDPFGIARAFVANLRNEGVQQGGSTITQQYVKNAYLSQERTVTRKLKEAALAVKIERELPKQEILLRYLNTIYFGRGAYGVQAASKTYFGKNVQDLKLSEAAYLAGLIRSPETADAQLPSTDPTAASQRDTADRRRTSVLDAMLEESYIDQVQHDAAQHAGWAMVLPRAQLSNFGKVAHSELGTEYFIEYVRHWMVSSGNFTDAEVYGGGLRVYTTLDFSMQKDAVDAVTSTLNQPNDPSGALVAIDDQGGVVAMMGGTDYQESRVNLATGVDGGGGGRQPGSSFKPFALAEAIKQGMPLSKTYNAPGSITIPLGDGSQWKVKNYADAGLGTLNLVEATQKSSNTAYAQLINDVGVDNVISLAQRMGVTGDLPEVPSIVLGTGSVSVLDMASGYSTFADEGEHIAPSVVTKVTDAKGKVLYERPQARDRVMTKDQVDQVNWTLNQVVEGGTATGAKYGQSIAGKTGTTESYRDAWFVGYTCRLTSAVWMGYPGSPNDPARFMDHVHGISVTGGSIPTEIWRKFMTAATKDLDSCPFPKPTIAPAPVTTFTPGTGVVSATSSTDVSASSSTTTTARPAPSTTTTAAPTSTTTAAPTTTTTAVKKPTP